MGGGCSSECVSYVCSGGILQCGLERRSISRSLWQTVFAAASTLAFFAAANWEFGPIVSSTTGSVKRWCKHVYLAVGEPYYAFAYSLISAFITWDTTSELKSTPRPLVAIMLNCPIFIEIPEEHSGLIDKSAGKQPNVLIRQSRVEVAESEGVTVAAAEEESKDEILVPSDDEYAEIEMQLQEVRECRYSRASPPIIEQAAAVRDLKKDGSPLEGLKSVPNVPRWTCELPANLKAPVAVVDQGGATEEKHLYIHLHPSPFDARQIYERRLLLRLGLAPTYEQVRFLRSRSTFQAVVTTLQGLGYMLGVAQRLVEHLKISPLEAILASFNVLVILQMLLNLYSCVHYQRPLLLRLSDDQFRQYLSHSRPETYPFLLSGTKLLSASVPIKISRLFLLIGACIALLCVVGFLFAFIYYALVYVHHCLLCSLTAFICILLALSAVILVGLLISKKFREHYSRREKLHLVVQLYTSLVSISSVLLALAATITCWDIFKTPNISLLSWIVPAASVKG